MPAPLVSAAYDPEYEKYLQQMQAQQAALDANGQTSSAPPAPDMAQDTQGLQAQPNAIAPATPDAAAQSPDASYAYATGQPYYDTGSAPPEQTAPTNYPAPPAASSPQTAYPSPAGGSQDKYGFGQADQFGSMQDTARTNPLAAPTGATSFGGSQPPIDYPTMWDKTDNALWDYGQGAFGTSGVGEGRYASSIAPERRNHAGLDNIQSEPTLNGRHDNKGDSFASYDPVTESINALAQLPGLDWQDVGNAAQAGVQGVGDTANAIKTFVQTPGSADEIAQMMGAETRMPQGGFGVGSIPGFGERLSSAPEFRPVEGSVIGSRRPPNPSGQPFEVNGVRYDGSGYPQLPDASAAAFPPVEIRGVPTRGRPGTADKIVTGPTDYPAVDLAAPAPEPATSFRRGNWDSLQGVELPRPTADIKAGAVAPLRGTTPASRVMEGTTEVPSSIPGTTRASKTIDGVTAAPVSDIAPVKPAVGKKVTNVPTPESTTTAEVQAVTDSSGKSGYQVVEKTALGDVPGPTFSSYKEATGYLNGLKKGAPKLRPAIPPEPVVKPPKSAVIVEPGPMTSAKVYRELGNKGNISGVAQKARNVGERTQNLKGALPAAGALAAGLGIYELANGAKDAVDQKQQRDAMGAAAAIPRLGIAGNSQYNPESTKYPVPPSALPQGRKLATDHSVPPSALPQDVPYQDPNLLFHGQPTADFVPAALDAGRNAQDAAGALWSKISSKSPAAAPSQTQAAPTGKTRTPITSDTTQWHGATPTALDSRRADMMKAGLLDSKGNLVDDPNLMTNGRWNANAVAKGLVAPEFEGQPASWLHFTQVREEGGLDKSDTVPYDASNAPVDVQTTSSDNTSSGGTTSSNGWVDYGSSKKSYGSGSGRNYFSGGYGGSSGYSGSRSSGRGGFDFESADDSGSFDWHSFLDDLDGDGEYSPSEIKAAKKKAKMSRMKGSKSRTKIKGPMPASGDSPIRRDILDALESSTGKSMPSRKFKP